MSTINIKCIDQVMTFENMPIITAGDQNVDKVQFDFCELWDGYIPVAIFFQQKEALSYSMIDGNGLCDIPNSIAKLSGKIYISVTGVNVDNQIRTTNILAYEIGEGVVDKSLQDEFAGDGTSEEEAQSIYKEILKLAYQIRTDYLGVVNDLAYLEIGDENEFEYDESMMESKIKAYTMSKSELNEKFDRLFTEINSNKRGINALNDAIESIEDRLSSATDQLNSVQGAIENLEKYVNSLDKVISSLMNWQNSVDSSLSKMSDEIKSLSESLNDIASKVN